MTATEVLRLIESRGTVVLSGAAALRSLRAAIDLSLEQVDLVLTFEPDCDPDLVDYLAVVTVDTGRNQGSCRVNRYAASRSVLATA